MEINPYRIYLDTIHRLPTSGRGPRKGIVKFISKMDHDLVWRKRILLGKSRSPVVIREHFDETTEKNNRRLLLIRRAVINAGRKVRLVGDKLTINSITFIL